MIETEKAYLMRNATALADGLSRLVGVRQVLLINPPNYPDGSAPWGRLVPIVDEDRTVAFTMQVGPAYEIDGKLAYGNRDGEKPFQTALRLLGINLEAFCGGLNEGAAVLQALEDGALDIYLMTSDWQNEARSLGEMEEDGDLGIFTPAQWRNADRHVSEYNPLAPAFKRLTDI
jgi:hypothetical protein